ncbi:MAG TPA: DUF1840 family protein [Burkholderiales bacterium]|nr:DUF1840 family protein [Burkholderiales bacterium]
MLVKFRSDAGASVLMFGDVAARLLKLMGMSGVVPAAILGKDVAAALARLQAALAVHGREVAGAPAGGDADAVAGIDLATRAFPLVKLLEAAAKEQADVIWEQAR